MQKFHKSGLFRFFEPFFFIFFLYLTSHYEIIVAKNTEITHFFEHFLKKDKNKVENVQINAKFKFCNATKSVWA